MLTLACSYVASRFYLHGPPGANNASTPNPYIPPEVLRREQELEEAEPEMNPWACLILLAVTVALMGVIAEFVRQSPPFHSSCKRADRSFPHSSLIVYYPCAMRSASKRSAFCFLIAHEYHPACSPRGLFL